MYIIGDNREMLRDKNLIPLSHQHQHALALCVRIERAPAGALADFRLEIEQIWQVEIQWHFAAEEQVLFPAAARFPEIRGLVEELASEHQQIRSFIHSFAASQAEDTTVREFAAILASHVRKEERQLFELCQQLMTESELSRVGDELNKVLAQASG